jgi:hypothetical protein
MNAKPITQRKPASPRPPWYEEAQTARTTARREGKSCVLLLNADSGAL